VRSLTNHRAGWAALARGSPLPPARGRNSGIERRRARPSGRAAVGAGGAARIFSPFGKSRSSATRPAPTRRASRGGAADDA